MPGQPRPHRHCVARMLDAGLQPPRAIVCQRKCPMALHHELVARTHLQRQSTEFARFAGELVVRVLPGEPTQRYEHVLCEFMREAQARAGLVMPHLPHSDMAKDGMRGDTVSPRSRRRNAFGVGQPHRRCARARASLLRGDPRRDARGDMGRQRWSLGGPYVEPLAPDRRRLLDIMQRYGQFQPVADATERALRDMTDTPFRPRFERCPHRAVGMPHCSPRRSLDERTGLRGQCKSLGGAPAESYRDCDRWLFRNTNTGCDQAAKPPCARVLNGDRRCGAAPLARSRGSAARPNPDRRSGPASPGRRPADRWTAWADRLLRVDLPRRPRERRVVSRAGAPAELGLARARAFLASRCGRPRYGNARDCASSTPGMRRWSRGSARSSTIMAFGGPMATRLCWQMSSEPISWK